MSDPTARQIALEVLLEWDRSKHAFVERVLHHRLEDALLSGPDRGFVTELCYGMVRHRNTIRHVSERLCHRPLQGYHRTLRAALTLGLYQIVYLRTPAHAAVDTTIDIWNEHMSKEWRPGRLQEGRGFLNAILRKASSSIEHFGIDERDPHDVECVWTSEGWARIPDLALPDAAEHRARHLGIKYSHPPEMVRIWQARYDEETLVALLIADNRTPVTTLVLRTGVDPELYRRKLTTAGIGLAPDDPGDTPVIRLPRPGPVPRLPGFDQGEFWVQDPTSRRMALLLPKREHATLLDLCASPGGKLAVLLDRGGIDSVLACDIGSEKLRTVAENVDRLGFDVRGIEVLEVPREPERIRIDRSFDQIIVDAPCSNTGVLGRRHEARWRFTPENLRPLQRTQLGLLRKALHLLAPGGDLVYSTCSIEPQENADVVHSALRSASDLRLMEEVELLPGPDGDGGYGALLRRRG